MRPRSLSLVRTSLVLAGLLLLGLVPSSRAQGPSWSKLPLTTGVHYHSVVYDAANQRLIAFGGITTSQFSNAVHVLPLNGPPVWQRITPHGAQVPDPRSGAAMILDPIRNRLWLHGGNGEFGVKSDLWYLNLSGPPVWTLVSPGGTVPGARWGHLSIYDPVRDRMVIFGGHTGSSRLNEVWALPLGSPVSWQALAPTGTPPAPRWGQGGAYDPAGDRIVLFGGNNLTTAFADSWTLTLAGTPAWSKLTPTGTPPAGRWAPAASFDPSRNRLMVFGGYDGASYFSDAWALDLDGAPAWQSISPNGAAPEPRFGTAWVFDPPRDRVVLYGGGTTQADVDDVWSLPLAGNASWERSLGPSSHPINSGDHEMVLDTQRSKVWLAGGRNAWLDDVWSLSLSGPLRWSLLPVTGTLPVGRRSHTLTYDPVRDRLIVFGGQSQQNGTILGDLWALPLGTDTPQWQPLTPVGTGPGPRHQLTGVYDPLRDRIVYFGGAETSGNTPLLNETWELSLAGAGTWTQLSPAGPAPPVRKDHAAVYDPVRDRMLVYGGLGASLADLADMWSLSLSGDPTWTQQPSLPIEMRRSGHSLLYVPNGDFLVGFGGFLAAPLTSTVWSIQFSGGVPGYGGVFTTGFPVPAARARHAAVYDPLGERMLVFGGLLVATHDDDVWSFNLGDGTLDTPLPRVGPVVELAAAFPDPAQHDVTIRYSLPAAAHATLHVYDVSGRRVATLADGIHAAGPHTLRWDRRTSSGAEARPGLYFYELNTSGTRVAKRVVLIE